MGLSVEEALANWTTFCKGDLAKFPACGGASTCGGGASTRGGGGPPSRDELDMERELNAKRAQILQHCDVAMFHAVVATALRWWAIVLKSDLRSRAPLRLWREALLILALEFELPGYASPLLEQGDAVSKCKALAIMCIGGASCLSAT